MWNVDEESRTIVLRQHDNNKKNSTLFWMNNQNQREFGAIILAKAKKRKHFLEIKLSFNFSVAMNMNMELE